jgi:hypothetical protein
MDTNTTNQKKPHPRTYVLTGKVQSGKRHVAKECGGEYLSFADPVHQVVQSLFGPDVKPGPLHQKIGEWGKGTIDDANPLTIERATFVLLLQKLGPELCRIPVEWHNYGKHPDLWIYSLLGHAFSLSGMQSAPLDAPFYPEVNVWVTARMKNELTELRKAEFDHFHVVCSEQTWIERLRQRGINLGDQRLKHVSEMMATELDRQVYALIRKEPAGSKLKVIWNDVRDCPSDRLFTLEEFQTYVTNNARKPEPETNTGESCPTETAAATPDLREGGADDAVVPEKAPAGKPKNRNTRKGPRTRKDS